MDALRFREDLVKLSLHCPGSIFNSPQSPAELNKKIPGKRRPSSLLKQLRKAIIIVHLPKYPRQENISLFIREIPHIQISFPSHPCISSLRHAIRMSISLSRLSRQPRIRISLILNLVLHLLLNNSLFHIPLPEMLNPLLGTQRHLLNRQYILLRTRRLDV
jgi:hypothetical protein